MPWWGSLLAKKTAKKPLKPEQQPFWKKLSPEIKSLTDHLGHFVDNLKVNDLADLAILASLAYLSFDKLGKQTIKEKKTETYISGYRTVTRGKFYPAGYIGQGMERETGPYETYQEPIYETREIEVDRIQYNAAAALYGPIGYKLATTMGGTPPVSQIAGLAALVGLGVAYAAGAYIDIGYGLKIGIPTLEDLKKTITG